MSKSPLVSSLVKLLAHIKISVYLAATETKRQPDGSPIGCVAGGSRGHAAEARRPVCTRRTDGQRIDPDPWSEPAAGFTPSEASVRGRSSRPFPRGELGFLSAEPFGPGKHARPPTGGGLRRNRPDNQPRSPTAECDQTAAG